MAQHRFEAEVDRANALMRHVGGMYLGHGLWVTSDNQVVRVAGEPGRRRGGGGEEPAAVPDWKRRLEARLQGWKKRSGRG